MTDRTCAWDETCDKPHRGLGLCGRHYQYAYRNGLLDQFRSAEHQCGRCGGPLPEVRRSNRVYCSKRCFNSAYYARDPESRNAAHKAWLADNANRLAAERLAKKVQRFCAECDAPLPINAVRRRTYCSRRCINTRSLREHPEKRLSANRKRRALIRAAGGPGVSDCDWRRLVNRYRSRCAYCDALKPLTMDHVVPIARGGWHAIGNVLPACFPCNAAKRDDFLAHWRRGIAAVRLGRRSKAIL